MRQLTIGAHGTVPAGAASPVWPPQTVVKPCPARCGYAPFEA
jgi:hypothetical protein